MPTLNRLELNRPKDWASFEDIVLDAAKLFWTSPMLQKNGRPGQKQDGVDIWGTDNLGRPVAIQCKKTIGKISKKIIEDEIKQAENFGHITALYIATTQDNDAPIQKEIRILSEARCVSKKFAVGILYWDDITNGLLLNHSIAKKHYPNIVIPASEQEYLNSIPAFELGFYGTNLLGFLDLICGEFGQIAQEDPDGLNVLSEIIDNNCQLLLPEKNYQSVKSQLENFLDYLQANKKVLDYPTIELLAKRVSSRLEVSDTFLTKFQQQSFYLGKQLGYAHCECAPELPDDKYFKKLKQKMISFLGAQFNKEIDELFSKISKNKSTSWVTDIKGFILHKLRWQIE